MDSSSSSDPPDNSPIVSTLTATMVGGATAPKSQVHRHALTAALIAMAVNFLIAFFKLGVNTFISPSASLFSEGLHSLGDGINSIILVFGIIRGNQTADRAHPFGYGLEANFWALFASIILFVSAGWAVSEGFHRFLFPVYGDHDYFWATVVLGISIVFEIYAIYSAARAILMELDIPSNVFTVIPKAYINVGRAKVPTTRYVFFEDTLALLGAVVALLAIVSSQFLFEKGLLSQETLHYPDAIGAIVIGILLFLLAFSLFSHNKEILIGSAASDKDEAIIRQTVLSLHGVSHIHNLKTIDQGHAGLIVYMTVEVEPDTPVKDVDDLTERIKERLSAQLKHVRPDSVFIEVLADETDEQWDAQFEALLTLGHQKEVLTLRDETLIRRAYYFRELLLRDVMVPRPDVKTFDWDTPLDEVLPALIEDGHTRWPVFGENDELLGIIHARDVYELALKSSSNRDVTTESLIRDINIYPETKKASDLLEEFKRKKLRMAAVADEHGSFIGIVTIEDLMEELVGEIHDEHAVEDLMLELLDPNTVLVSGKYNIEDLNDALALNFPTEEFVTIGGFIFGQLGREPQADDTIMFEDLKITVAAVDGPRVQTLRIDSPKVMSFTPAMHSESLTP